MTLMETKKRNERFNAISERMSRRFSSENIKGRKFYKNGPTCYFRLDEFPGENALVIEYADNKNSAENNMLEDGERFYCDKLSEEQMFNEMLKEIGN